MLLNVSHIFKSFGEDGIIKDATFTVDEGSKVAIVGNRKVYPIKNNSWRFTSGQW